jgi:hypothetical protein
MLLIMHHIVLCTSCIAVFNYDHLLHIRVDHVEPKTEDQAKQVQWVLVDPKRQVARILISLRIKESSGASNHLT